MGSVVCTDTYAVELFVIKHFLMARVEMNAADSVSFHEGFGLTGYKIGSGDDLNVVHLQIAFKVRVGDSAGTDDTYADLLSGELLYFIGNFLSKLTENCVTHLKLHTAVGGSKNNR